MRTECIHCGGSLRNSDTDGQHADVRTCVGRIAKILKSKDDHIARIVERLAAANALGIQGVCGKDVTPGGRTCVNPPDHAGPCVGC